MNIEIPERLEGRIVDEAVDHITSHIHDDLQSKLDKAVERAVKTHIEELVRKMVAERLEPFVDEVFKCGLKRTNNWGETSKPNMTIAEYLREQLTAKRDRYGHATTALDSFCCELIKKELESKDFQAEVAKAKTAFRAKVDNILQAEIVTGLRKAFGL